MNRSRSWIALIGLVLLIGLSPEKVFSASATWSGGTDANWSNSANWSAGGPAGAVGSTTNTETATFDLSPANGTSTPVVIDQPGQDVGSLAFAATAGAYTIGTTGGNALHLTIGGSISNVSGTSAIETINAPLTIESGAGNGSYTFSSNSSTAADVMVFGGTITALPATSRTTTLILTGTNTGINIINGAFAKTGAGGFAVTISGSTWSLAGSSTALSAVNVNTGGTLDLNGQGETLSNLTSSSGAGTVTNSGALATLSLTGGNFTGQITGGANLALSIDGGVTLSNSLNSYSGGTIINKALTVGAGGSLGTGPVTLATNGSTISLTLTAAMTLGTSSVTTNGSRSNINFTDAGTNPTYDLGTVNINGGTVFNQSGATTGTPTITLNGSFNLASSPQFLAPLRTNAFIWNIGADINMGSATQQLQIGTPSNALIEFTGNITGTGTPASTRLTFTNAASASPMVLVMHANTYTQATTIFNGVTVLLGNSTVVSGGSITSGPLGTANSGTAILNLNSSTTAGNLLFYYNAANGFTTTGLTAAYNATLIGSSAVVTLGGQNTTGIDTFSGNFTMGNGALAASAKLVSAAGGEVDFTGNLLQFSATTANVTVGDATNTGTIKLAGANTYTGTTTVAGGLLRVNGTHTAAGAYTINSGGTLGGNGSITTATGSPTGVTVASGGKLSPGSDASTVGTLTLILASGTLDIAGATGGANAGALVFDLGSSLTRDKIVLTTGTLVVGSGAGNELTMNDFSFTGQNGVTTGQYTLFDTNNTITNFANITTGIGSSASFGGFFTGYLSLANSNQDLVLNVTVAPEPTFMTLLGLSGLIFLGRRRVRHPN